VSSTSPLYIVAGVAFTVFWLAAAGLWAALSFMGGAMANDSGRVPAEAHATFLMMMIAGEILVALAGFPAGLAFFWGAWRTILLILFGGLLLAGVGLQIWAFWSFASAAG
jgi:hypothetical protein